MILALTDGYADSYPSIKDPVAVFGTDLWTMIGTHGLDKVKANLERWLSEITEKGSGDDITVGLLCRLEAFLAR